MDTINPSTTLRACLDALTRPFTPEQIRQREGRGGKMLDYLETHAVITRLNEAFAGAWSFEVVDYKTMEGEIVVHGKLTAGGQVKAQFGSADIHRLKGQDGERGAPVSIGDDLKAAASDALKKCATLFGVGLHLYDKPQAAQRPPQQRQTQQADRRAGAGAERAAEAGQRDVSQVAGHARDGQGASRAGRSGTNPGLSIYTEDPLMSVFKRNDAWWIDTYVKGQRVRRKIGPDKRTAELAEKDLQVRAAQGKWLGIEQPKRVTFSEFCKEFRSKQTGKAPNTVLSYERACGYLEDFMGRRYLSDIRPRHVEDYQQERAKVADFGTVNLELAQLKAILNAAVRWGYLMENPAKGVRPLRLPEKEPPFMTRDQVARLYPACTGWLHTFVALALNTGLRLSEILALKWEDIDLRNRVVKVRSDEEFTTKGKRNRMVPINDFLAGVLSRVSRHITSPFVIYNKGGASPKACKVWSRFKYALKQAGLPHFRVHDLRHTYGTTLAANGVDVVTIMKLMGHSDIKTTMRYLHSAPDRLKWAAENLHLDGTTQAQMDEQADPKMGRDRQDLVTGAKAGA